MKPPLPTRTLCRLPARGALARGPVARGPVAREGRATVTRWGRVQSSIRAVLFMCGALMLAAARPTAQPPGFADRGATDSRSLVALPGELPRVMFTDITDTAGIDFRHENGARGEKLLPETMGGGSAFFDFDSDGDQDLLLINSPSADAGQSRGADSHATMVLYRNDGRGNFADATAGSGLDIALQGMGAAVGDYDNDGRIDVFLSAVGENRLFRNLGAGKFADVTATAGVAGEADQWSSGCGWFDYDNDGDLDLFVCNYLRWTREHDLVQHFRLPNGRPAYGRPQNFAGAFPYLYRNDGGGKFTDVSQQAGIQIRDPVTGAAASKALGVTFHDFDRDGRLDIVVANDTVQNQLFRNVGQGRFEELGALAGIGFDDNGGVRGAMGIDAAHFLNDDSTGVAIGNFANEMMALYVSDTDVLQFSDKAAAVGLGAATHQELTFGTCFVDYDLDGRLDLLAANGHLEPEISQVQSGQHYAQPPQLFWNGGPRRGNQFLPVTSHHSGLDLARPTVGRGASFADIDGDGDLDLLITANGRAPRLLRNDQQLGHHWLRLRLVGSSCNRDAIGAEVEVQLPGRTLRRVVMPTRSYLSQVELPLTMGLGDDDRVLAMTIRWPDGSRQVIRDIQVDRAYEIQQGSKSLAGHVRPTNRQKTQRIAAGRTEVRPAGPPFPSPAVSTSCGNYLHRQDAMSHVGPHRSPSPRPCHGPLCSQAPRDHQLPPPAPRHSTNPQQDALLGIGLALLEWPFSRLIPDATQPLPHFASGRIFRPPRCC